VDLRCAPIRILSRHAVAESSNSSLTDRRAVAIASASTGESPPDAIRLPSPVHNDQKTSDQHGQMCRSVVQKQAVEAVQGGSRPHSFEHGDLLSQSENFQRGIHARRTSGWQPEMR
jgi:hypothetical protein